MLSENVADQAVGTPRPMSLPANEVVIKGRLYDLSSRGTVAEFTDSCAAAGDSPVLLTRIMVGTGQSAQFGTVRYCG